MNNTNNFTAREAYQRARTIYINASLAAFDNDIQRATQYVDGLKMSQSELRLEVNLVTTATQFIFGVTQNQANTTNVVFPTEKRLNLQDAFVANEYGIYVAQTTGNNDAAYSLRTYPNTQDFAAADVAALQSTFYSNGNFSVICNGDVVAPYRGLWNHLYRPQTQQTAALGAGAPADQVRPSEDGLITLEPNLLLIGTKGYQPQINLPAALASAAANLRCILIFKGVLAQNATSVS